jgi:hypothetical protein
MSTEDDDLSENAYICDVKARKFKKSEIKAPKGKYSAYQFLKKIEGTGANRHNVAEIFSEDGTFVTFDFSTNEFKLN